jgi:predicted dehydrogenase
MQNVSLLEVMDATPLRIGLVGCGKISATYTRNLNASPEVEVVACADQFPERARQLAAEFGVPKACEPEELLNDPLVELVLNLTVPTAHAEVSLRALGAGKHVHSEKPLATNREDGRRILDMARTKGLSVSCAPDTFLGAGLQTCLSLTEGGELGDPLAASAFMLQGGPENWHPSPAAFYGAGAGPLLDMGPYYVTALVCLLGPVRRVSGMSRVLYPEVTATRGAMAGQPIKVTAPTFVAGLLEFESGAQATLVMSFGITGHNLPHMEVYCGGATISIPDPNTFGGPVKVRSNTENAVWREVELRYRHTDARHDWRGIGVVEAAQAIRSGIQPRASGELAYHVLDVMLSILESHENGRHVTITSTCARPALLPLDADLVAAP